MSGIAEIQGRIAEIQSAMETLRTGVAAASTTSSSSGASGTAFADALAAAQADSAAAVTGLDSSDSFAASDAVSSTATSSLGAAGSLAAAGAGSSTGAGLVASAEKYLGVPYVWGGTNPATGLDCSGLVQRAMADLGVKVPRVAHDQAKLGTAVSSLAAAKPGDLIVFGGGSHIGIYVGGGKMVDAPKPGKSVSVRDVYETPTAIRRVLPEASAVPTSAAAGSSTSSADLQRYALSMMSDAVAA